MQETKKLWVRSLGWDDPLEEVFLEHDPFQCSCLENPMKRGDWWATAHGIAKSQTQLSDD